MGELNARTGKHINQPCLVRLEPSSSEFPQVRPSLALRANQVFVNRSLVMLLFLCVETVISERDVPASDVHHPGGDDRDGARP